MCDGTHLAYGIGGSALGVSKHRRTRKTSPEVPPFPTPCPKSICQKTKSPVGRPGLFVRSRPPPIGAGFPYAAGSSRLVECSRRALVP
jgi:hypothetical protein